MNSVQEHKSIFDSIMELQEHDIDSDCLIVLSSIENACYYVHNYLTIVQDTIVTTYNTDDQTLTDVRCVVDGTLSETVSGRATITKGKKTESIIEAYTCRTTSASYHGCSYEEIGSSHSKIKTKTSYVVGAINVGFLKGLFNLPVMNFACVCGIGMTSFGVQVECAAVSSEAYLFRQMMGQFIIESYRAYFRFKGQKEIPKTFVPKMFLGAVAPAPTPKPDPDIDSDFLEFCDCMEYHHGLKYVVRVNAEEYQ